jgi:Rhodopirellula transposase DDE domain
MRDFMTPYPPHIERSMRSFYRSLRENDRRVYAALEATKLGHGGVEYISAVLDIDPKTIRRGQRDLDDLPDRPRLRVRKPGGGPKRKLDEDPKIDADFRTVLVEHTAGSPTEESLIWTDLTRTEIVDLMQGCGNYISVHIVDQLLDRHGFHRRKAQRMEPLSRHPDRNSQFETIARLKGEYFDSPDPILSMDLKSREVLGNFFRDGPLWTRERIRVFDHDLEEFAQGVALPHGLYDPALSTHRL